MTVRGADEQSDPYLWVDFVQDIDLKFMRTQKHITMYKSPLVELNLYVTNKSKTCYLSQNVMATTYQSLLSYQNKDNSSTSSVKQMPKTII